MIIRINYPEGKARIEIQDSESTTLLLQKIAAAIGKEVRDIYVCTDRSNPNRTGIHDGHSLSSQTLKNGDVLEVIYSLQLTATTQQARVTKLESIEKQTIKQAPIDDYLEKQDGLLKGNFTSMCKHGPAGMCDYCMPTEGYLDAQKIKHMSFHAYLKQQCVLNKTAPYSSSQFIPPLNNHEFKVKNPCPSKLHGPFPQGICTKCQPSSATLTSQTFRQVDHVEFDTPQIIETFLNYWRRTAYQRYGILYGKYEPYELVPLGIKAVVSAIYEPPQQNDTDSLQINPQAPDITAVTALLGLVPVGMIYTDLTPEPTGKGAAICKRHADSYFMSSAECVFSAQMQLAYPVVSKYAAEGVFGSRFVTCILTGDENNAIDVQGYMVSHIGMAMTHDKIIEASTDPSLMRVVKKEDVYVPEVFFKYKNEYGIMVKDVAKPTFPTDYLIVTVTHGFPIDSNLKPMFTGNFAVENREGLDTQTMDKVKKSLGNDLVTGLSDFHLVIYIAGLQILDTAAVKKMCEVAVTKNPAALSELQSMSSWKTFEMILMNSDMMDIDTPSQGSKRNAPWACKYCTYTNEGADSCEMCGLPKDQ